MARLVVYDSAYGNTARIAQEIARKLGAEAKLVKDITRDEVLATDLLVMGSPTQGGQPTGTLAKFLKTLSKRELNGTKAAAFDTRFAIQEQGRWLRILMRIIGYAAPKLSLLMKSKGAAIIMPPEGFIVNDKEGPLKNGELERAAAWAEQIAKKA